MSPEPSEWAAEPARKPLGQPGGARVLQQLRAQPPHRELFPLCCQVLEQDPAFLLQQLKGSAQTKHRAARREALRTEGTRAGGSEGQLQIWTRAETAARSPGLVLSGVS